MPAGKKRKGFPKANTPWQRPRPKSLYKKILALALLFSAASESIYPQDTMLIEIVPFGSVNETVLGYLKENLGKGFNARVSIGQPRPLPEYAFNKTRGQYQASAILDNLTKVKKDARQKILAIIDKDLCAPDLNFVFGEADPTNGVCVISIKRLRQSYYGLAEDSNLLLERGLKEAAHEMGHLLNLSHCPNPKCVMYFSNTISDTDRKDSHFCGNCK